MVMKMVIAHLNQSAGAMDSDGVGRRLFALSAEWSKTSRLAGWMVGTHLTESYKAKISFAVPFFPRR